METQPAHARSSYEHFKQRLLLLLSLLYTSLPWGILAQASVQVVFSNFRPSLCNRLDRLDLVFSLLQLPRLPSRDDHHNKCHAYSEKANEGKGRVSLSPGSSNTSSLSWISKQHGKVLHYVSVDHKTRHQCENGTYNTMR